MDALIVVSEADHRPRERLVAMWSEYSECHVVPCRAMSCCSAHERRKESFAGCSREPLSRNGRSDRAGGPATMTKHDSTKPTSFNLLPRHLSPPLLPFPDSSTHTTRLLRSALAETELTFPRAPDKRLISHASSKFAAVDRPSAVAEMSASCRRKERVDAMNGKRRARQC
jgi:hypothetical protein